MAKGSLLDIDMYKNNTTGPLEIMLAKATVSIRNTESTEQAVFIGLVIDAYALLSAAIRTIKAIIKATKVSIRNARRIRTVNAAATAATAAGVVPVAGTAVAVAANGIRLGATGGLVSHIVWAINRCRKRIKRLLKRCVNFVADVVEWREAVKATNAARELGADLEQRLLAAKLSSAEFARKLIACRRRIMDHKESVVKYYTMLLKAGKITKENAIRDKCASHDDDKLVPFNLARQALRFISPNEPDPAETYLSMMKWAVEEHEHSNRHHPEYWSNASVGEANQPAAKMPLMYIGEMCADWAAMSEEKGTSLTKWMKTIAFQKYRFTDEQRRMIEECCAYLEPFTKGNARSYGYNYYDPSDRVKEDPVANEEGVSIEGNAILESHSDRDVVGAIRVLLDLVGETDDAIAAPVTDNDYMPAGAEPGIGDGVSDTVETEAGMSGIMDELCVPEHVRAIAPQLLNNIVHNDDGTFVSIDGSVRMADGNALKSMIGNTLIELGKVIGEGGHSNVSIGDDLKARIVMRDRNGHRREVSMGPVVESVAEKRPLTEGDCGLVMCFGGRGESSEPQQSAVDMFNRMALDNQTFGRNMILDRLSKFDHSDMFTGDDEPELDEYTQTMFLDGLGDHGYDVNGDPYGEFKKMQAELTGEMDEPEIAAPDTGSAMAFMNSFGKVFQKN